MNAKKLMAVFKNLTMNKKRSFFAMLGVAIGVAAVVSLLSFGQGTQEEVNRQLEKMGTNLLVVSPAKANPNLPGKKAALATTLITEDAEALQEQLSSINAAVPVQSKSLQVKSGTQVLATNIVGTLPGYQEVRNFWPEAGRFFLEEEVKGNQRVAVLGRAVAEGLFGDADPIGANMRINNVNFTIIGFMEAKGVDATGQDQDDQVFIPLTTAGRRVINQEYLNNIYVQVSDGNRMEEVQVAITGLLTGQHRIKDGEEPDFVVQNHADVLAAQSEVDTTFNLLLLSIALVSLLVGGVGILAVMLMAIKERTWEIGLRRALGAKKKDILWQFILEALFLSLGGGLLGTALGLGGDYLAGYFAGWPVAVSWPIILLACCFAVFVGLIFGIYPAQKASKLNPIEALRTE